MKRARILSVLAFAALASCTGDPNAGGIFWSPSMAQERQDNLRNELQAQETAYTAVAKEQQQTRQKLATLRKRLAETKAAAAAPATTPQEAQEVQKLQAEAQALENEIKALNAILLH